MAVVIPPGRLPKGRLFVWHLPSGRNGSNSLKPSSVALDKDGQGKEREREREREREKEREKERERERERVNKQRLWCIQGPMTEGLVWAGSRAHDVTVRNRAVPI